MSKRVVIDLETFSELDVKNVGAWIYSTHPSTEVLCVGYQIDDQPKRLWTPATQQYPFDLYLALLDERCIFVAHNAFFEWSMWNNCLKKKYPQSNNVIPIIAHSRMSCTAARARRMALPGKLEILCQALKIKHQKDMEGHRLMLKMCKPRKPTKHNPSTRHNDPEDIKRLGLYCLADISAQVEIDKLLPEIPPGERELWTYDQKLNARGIAVDVPLCHEIKAQIKVFTQIHTAELRSLTHGELQTVGQNNAYMNYCHNRGIPIANMQKKTIEEWLRLKGEMPPDVARALQIRLSLSKSSTKKYDAFIARADGAGRVRDLWTYHTASTGRWGGAGIQPQNFPRGVVKDVASAIEVVKMKDAKLMQALFDEPMDVYSSLLRSMIVAEKGHELYCADYSGIELRVLMWLVNQENALKLIRNGEDLYCYQASDIFGRLITKEDKDERFVGKEAVLGMGYQMGAPKFQTSVALKGKEISIELATKAVKSYRKKFDRVAKFWNEVEIKAMHCLRSGQKTPCGKISFEVIKVKGREFLICNLPSGRRLYYPFPSIKNKLTHWGEVKPQLHYWGFDSQRQKWEEQHIYGGKWTENIVQAIARDLMAHGALRTEAAGYPLLLMVHDELLSSRPKGQGDIKEFEKLMCELPPWATGVPLGAEGWTGPRYKK